MEIKKIIINGFGVWEKRVLKSIEASLSSTSFDYNHTLGTGDLTVTAYYDDNTSSIISSGYTHNFNSNSVGAHTLTVSYTEDGVTATATGDYTINRDYTITGISITTKPSKTEYNYGDSIDTSGMEVTAYYADGTILPVSDYDYSPKKAETVGNNTLLTVSYTEGGVTAKATTLITVYKVLSHIKISQYQTKTYYVPGEYFDKSDMVVKAHYTNDTFSIITDYTVDTTTPLTENDTSVTVSYSYRSVTKSVTVPISMLQGITILTASADTEYNNGETFNTASLTVANVYNGMCARATEGEDYKFYIDGKEIAHGDVLSIEKGSGVVTKTVTIKSTLYDAYTESFEITIKSYLFTMTITNRPELRYANVAITVTNDRTKENYSVGENGVSIEYFDASTTFTIREITTNRNYAYPPYYKHVASGGLLLYHATGQSVSYSITPSSNNYTHYINIEEVKYEYLTLKEGTANGGKQLTITNPNHIPLTVYYINNTCWNDEAKNWSLPLDVDIQSVVIEADTYRTVTIASNNALGGCGASFIDPNNNRYVTWTDFGSTEGGTNTL